jgi:hypothetical protein
MIRVHKGVWVEDRTLKEDTKVDIKIHNKWVSMASNSPNKWVHTSNLASTDRCMVDKFQECRHHLHIWITTGIRSWLAMVLTDNHKEWFLLLRWDTVWCHQDFSEYQVHRVNIINPAKSTECRCLHHLCTVLLPSNHGGWTLQPKICRYQAVILEGRHHHFLRIFLNRVHSLKLTK